MDSSSLEQSKKDDQLLSAVEDRDLTKIRALIAANADVNAVDIDSNTPLLNAVINGHDNVVSVLIAASAKLDEADQLGFTALMKAAKLGHTSIISTLIDAGANIKKERSKGGGTTALALSATCPDDGPALCLLNAMPIEEVSALQDESGKIGRLATQCVQERENEKIPALNRAGGMYLPAMQMAQATATAATPPSTKVAPQEESKTQKRGIRSWLKNLRTS